jgi:hypothetical protein
VNVVSPRLARPGDLVDGAEHHWLRAHLPIVEGENQLPGCGIHLAPVGNRAEDVPGGLREELDSCGAGICQQTARTFLKHQQVVGQAAGGHPRGSMPRASIFQTPDCPRNAMARPSATTTVAWKRLELLLYQRNGQRLSQQVDLE